MDEIASAIAAAVEEQAATTTEIAQNIQQVAQGSQETMDAMSEVKTAADDTGKVADQVLAASRDLMSRSGYPEQKRRRLHGRHQGGLRVRKGRTTKVGLLEQYLFRFALRREGQRTGTNVLPHIPPKSGRVIISQKIARMAAKAGQPSQNQVRISW